MEHKSGLCLQICTMQGWIQTVEEEMAAEAAYLVTQLGSVCPVAESDGQKLSSRAIHGNIICGEGRVRCQC